MPPEDAYNCVLNPDDALQSQHHLVRLHDVERGRCVCEVSHAERSPVGLSQVILEALGKDLDLPGSKRSGTVSWMHAVIWLRALGINDLFVSRAHLANGGGWQWLAELATASGTRLWLVAAVAKLGRGQREATKRWGFRSLNWAEFVNQRPEPAKPQGSGREATPPEAPFPEVPEADFTVFLAWCKRGMNASELARVRDAFTAGANAVERIEPETEAIAALVLAQSRASSSINEAIARVRGVQARLLWLGWLVRVDPSAIRAGLSEQADACEVRGRGAAPLLAYADPMRAAAGTLAIYADQEPAQMARLSLRELDRFSKQAQERPLAVACRAYYLQRLLDRAQPGDPAFVREESPAKAAGAHMIRRRLRHMTAETALPLVRRWNPAKSEPPSTLARRAGIRISHLDDECDG